MSPIARPRAEAKIRATVVAPRDRARQSRVKVLFAANGLTTANDYYHAAMILQHGDAPEDFLLAHELLARREPALEPMAVHTTKIEDNHVPLTADGGVRPTQSCPSAISGSERRQRNPR